MHHVWQLTLVNLAFDQMSFGHFCAGTKSLLDLELILKGGKDQFDAFWAKPQDRVSFMSVS